MQMSAFKDWTKGRVLHGLLARAVLLALVVRAMVPAGYMPDFSATSQGLLKVVICGASGAKALAADAKLHDGPGQTQSAHDQPCTYSGMTVAAVASMEPAGLHIPGTAIQHIGPHLVIVLEPSRAGPVLGSRGPPQLT